MIDTWYNRDLPVLVAAAAHLDQFPRSRVHARTITPAVELDFADVERALTALTDGGYLRTADDARMSGRRTAAVGLTEKGRREAGLWPDPEALTNRLLDAIKQQIENATDPDTRNRLQKLFDSARALPREILVSLIGSLGSGTILGM